MHVKRSMSKAERQRLMAASDSATDSDSAGEEHSEDEKPMTKRNKRKSEAQESSQPNKTSRKTENRLNAVHEPLFEGKSAVDEVELELLAIETRRLDFEVAKWKQQQALRRQTLQLKSEEIKLKETTTKQQQQTQMMENRARLIKALDEAGTAPAQGRKYLALLEG